MKRLLRGAPSAAGQAGGDVFKVPSSRGGRKDSQAAEDSQAGIRDSQPSTAKSRPVVKSERSRPLPRGDSTAGATEVLQRRVVSLGKRARPKPVTASASQAALPAMGTVVLPDDDTSTEIVMRKRKRKSLSPKSMSCGFCQSRFALSDLIVLHSELDPSARSSRDLILAPDTPVKASAPSSASFRNPFSRPPSLPSFAALGAAFRAGAAPPDDTFSSFRLPSPPPVPSTHVGSPGNWRSLLLHSEGSQGVDGGASAPSSAGTMTPKRPPRVLVPDT